MNIVVQLEELNKQISELLELSRHFQKEQDIARYKGNVSLFFAFMSMSKLCVRQAKGLFLNLESKEILKNVDLQLRL